MGKRGTKHAERLQGGFVNILFLTPSLPYPPHQGGAMRNYGLLRAAADAGHTVTLVSFTDHEPGYLPAELERLAQQIITVRAPARNRIERLRDFFLSPSADLAKRLESPAMRAELNLLLRSNRYEVIQFEGLEMAAYLDQAARLQPEARLIYDAHNAEYALQAAIAETPGMELRARLASLYSRVQSRRIGVFEKHICQQAHTVIAVSREDADLLRGFRADGQVHVLPNGIDVEQYQTPFPASEPLKQPALVFTGKMDYRPNVDAVGWFCREVLPLITAQVHDAHLYVVGQRPHPSLNFLHTHGQVTVTGAVPSVQPYLHQAAVYIAPLRMGSGTRLKILEALAGGCAVVATPMACSGLSEAVLSAVILADSPKPFADAVIRLLKNPALREQIRARGSEAVRAHYDWSVLAPQYVHILEDERSG